MPWSEKTNLATEASVKRKQVQHLVVFQTREFSLARVYPSACPGRSTSRRFAETAAAT